MKINKSKSYYRCIYIFFIFLSSIIFFFSTTESKGEAYKIDDVEISKPFEIKFNKNEVIDEGFYKAFKELIMLITNTADQKKVKDIKLNQIKAMIESFTIKEEKFVDEIYHLNLGVSFNKKKIFKYLEKKNIFPSIPSKKKFLFIPIIIDEEKKDLFIFANNQIYNEWMSNNESHHLIEYILPAEDLEDLKIIKDKYEYIEKYDFKEISNKYYLENSIIALVFKKGKDIRILSRITIKDNIILKNKSFENLNLDNIEEIGEIIQNLKDIYEDHWKNSNQINTSIKLPLSIKVKGADKQKVLSFEKILEKEDLVYDFFINRYDKDYIIYNIIFNGTPNIFLKSMKDGNFIFDTQNKVWILK